MPNRYALIDHENIQPKDLALLDGQAVKIIVFLGASQAKISAELATALQKLGRDGEYVRGSANGRNALDMHIAFYLGQLAAKDPSAQVYVISKDKDYDPLIAHLQSKGLDVRRSATLAGLLPPANERLEKAIDHLSGPKPNRPRRKSTLANALNNLWGKSLSEAEIEGLIAELVQRGVLSVDGTKVAYPSA